MNRAEHLAWAKDRAQSLVDEGDLTGAYASMASDLSKHEDLSGHPGIVLGMMLLAGGQLSDRAAMRDHIEGYR